MDRTVSGRKRWPPEDDERGLECRHCGCRHFLPVATRLGHRGQVVRRLGCRHCGLRVTNHEDCQVPPRTAQP